MRDGEPKAFRQENEPADARGRLELPRLLVLVFARLHEGGLAGRPGDGAVGTKRDLVDPAMFRIGPKRLALALGIGRDHFAVVAPGHHALAVGGRAKHRAAMNVDAPRLAFAIGQHDRFLGQNEGYARPKKMRGNDRAFRRDLVRAVNDRGRFGLGVGH